MGILSSDILLQKDHFIEMNEKEKKKWIESIIRDLSLFSENDTPIKISLISMDMNGPID